MVNSILPVPDASEMVPSVPGQTTTSTTTSETTTVAQDAETETKQVTVSEQEPKSVFIDANKKAEDFRNYGKDTPRYETVRAFYEEQHLKQTYEFATKMREEYTKESRCTMPVWEALMFVQLSIQPLHCGTRSQSVICLLL